LRRSRPDLSPALAARFLLIPLSDDQDFVGMRLAKRGILLWRLPSGELEYADFELERLRYNVVEVP
jgi:hypothetical protein